MDAKLEGFVSDQSYAGDVSPKQAWQILEKDSAAVLVDCRTDAEWSWVGLPDLGSLGRAPVCVAWQNFPEMARNDGFLAELESQGVTKERTLLLLCRSGQRSRHAAIALTAAGYACCYNVADGFEGPCDDARHRGCDAGWKASGLPWIQG